MERDPNCIMHSRETDRIAGVIFDIDGVVLDSMPYWHTCGERFLRSIGIEAEPGLGDLLFTQTPMTGARYLIDHYGLDMTVEEVAAGTNSMMKQPYEELIELKPGAAKLLERIRAAGIPMTVASSTGRPFLETAFHRLGIEQYFLQILSCDEYETTKAEPKIFHAAAELMGSEPRSTWVIEDGLYSIRTAAAAGFRTVGIYDEASAADWEEIRRIADYHYSDLLEFDLL